MGAPDEEEKSGSNGGKGVIALVGVIFLLATLTGFLYYSMLRFFRQRFSVILSTVILVDVIALAYWQFSGAADNLAYTLSNFSNFADNWTDLIPAWIVVNILLGGFFGLLLTLVQLRQIRANPHQTKLKGSWLYRFKFRRTPLQWLRRRRIIAGLKNGIYSSNMKAPLGLDEANGDKIAYRYNSEAIKPTLISGAAGSGKTITMLSMMKNDIENGIPLIAIDFKRSPEFVSKMAAWSKENGREFYHFVNGDVEKYDVKDSPGQAFYDPFINGGASKADMVLGMRDYDVAATVWKDSQRQLLQVLFAMFKYADKSQAPEIDWEHGEIFKIASAILPGNFTDLVGACEGTPIQKNAEEIEIGTRSKTSNLNKAMEELRGQMRTIVSSEYGKWLRTEKGKRNIDLFELTRDAKDSVILFSLNSDSEKDFSRYLGSLILADLNAVSAKRRNEGSKNQVNVYVDEFQAVSPTSITSLLEKSRESKLAMTISSQSYEQIIAASDMNGEAYLLGILDTCSNFIVHAGATENSATRLSQILGKHYEPVYTSANQSEGFLFSNNFFNKRNQNIKTSEEERWVKHPREFMALSSPSVNNGYRSTAVVINKAPDDPLFKNIEGASARTVWMIPNDDVIGEYYIPKLSSDDSDSENDDPEFLEFLDLEDEIEESSILEEDEAPVDYLSTRLSKKKTHRKVEIDEDFENFDEEYEDFEDGYDAAGSGDESEDGDFEWEEVEEEDDSFNDYDEVADLDWEKTVVKSPKPVSEPIRRRPALEPESNFEEAVPKVRRSSLEASSFDELFKSDDFKPETLKKPSSNIKPVRKGGIPRVPVMPVFKESDDDDDYEEEALPDLEGLM